MLGQDDGDRGCAKADSSVLVVMTFNTANDLVEPDELIAMIARSDATIVGLQELSPRNARAVEAGLRDEFPHRVLHAEYFRGKGLLSRYPLLDYERFELPSGRPYIEARLAVQSRLVTVFVAHPPPPDLRRLQVASPIASQDIRALLRRTSLHAPTLLIGDFNCVRTSLNYHLLRQSGLIDTFRAVGRGRGRTYPARRQHVPIGLPPLVRIDYIWATPHFLPLASWLESSVGSDHLPVVSELALRPD